ncbi:TPA: hypothetical protein ACH3X2_010804 [Trebouxia sp. C0005]
MVKLPVLEALTAVAKAGIPLPIDLTSNLGNASLAMPTPLSGAPSGSLPHAAQASALLPPTSPASISAPSTTASLGKHFKADLPRPEYFRQLDSSADISRWLLRTEEYLTLMNYDLSIWSVVAAQFLGRAPRDLWDSFKAENGLVTAYPWPEFKARCIATFNLHDMEKQAFTKLMSLRQIASVAEYKAAHDVLAAKSKLPTAQRLIYWEQDLKPEIRAECKLDPLTHTAYANLAAAQTAALAVDSHFSSVVSGKKRAGPTAATATVASKKPRTEHEQSPTVPWSINGNKFHCARNGIMQLPLPQFFTESPPCPRLMGSLICLRSTSLLASPCLPALLRGVGRPMLGQGAPPWPTPYGTLPIRVLLSSLLLLVLSLHLLTSALLCSLKATFKAKLLG